MGKASYWQRGETIDYANSGTETIEADTIVVFGSRIGVAGTNILPGEKGSLHVAGVFGMPKGNGGIAAGADVYYSTDSGEICASEESGTKAGFAICDAGNDEPYVYVKINA